MSGASTSALAPPIPLGSRVVVTGVPNAEGVAGKVVAFNAGPGRYRIETDAGPKLFLPPANLVQVGLLPPPPPPPPPPEAVASAPATATTAVFQPAFKPGDLVRLTGLEAGNGVSGTVLGFVHGVNRYRIEANGGRRFFLPAANLRPETKSGDKVCGKRDRDSSGGEGGGGGSSHGGSERDDDFEESSTSAAAVARRVQAHRASTSDDEKAEEDDRVWVARESERRRKTEPSSEPRTRPNILVDAVPVVAAVRHASVPRPAVATPVAAVTTAEVPRPPTHVVVWVEDALVDVGTGRWWETDPGHISHNEDAACDGGIGRSSTGSSSSESSSDGSSSGSSSSGRCRISSCSGDVELPPPPPGVPVDVDGASAADAVRGQALDKALGGRARRVGAWAASVGALKAASASSGHQKARKFRLQLDRAFLVEDLCSQCTAAPLETLLRTPAALLGSREPGTGKWQTEGGGRMQGVMDLGGPTAEAFACFFDAARPLFYAVDASNGRAKGTRLDDELVEMGRRWVAAGGCSQSITASASQHQSTPLGKRVRNTNSRLDKSTWLTSADGETRPLSPVMSQPSEQSNKYKNGEKSHLSHEHADESCSDEQNEVCSDDARDEGDGSGDDACTVLSPDSTLCRSGALSQFEALGRVFLWALLQGRPVPSDLLDEPLLLQVLGIDPTGASTAPDVYTPGDDTLSPVAKPIADAYLANADIDLADRSNAPLFQSWALCEVQMHLADAGYEWLPRALNDAHAKNAALLASGYWGDEPATFREVMGGDEAFPEDPVFSGPKPRSEIGDLVAFGFVNRPRSVGSCLRFAAKVLLFDQRNAVAVALRRGLASSSLLTGDERGLEAMRSDGGNVGGSGGGGGGSCSDCTGSEGEACEPAGGLESCDLGGCLWGGLAVLSRAERRSLVSGSELVTGALMIQQLDVHPTRFATPVRTPMTSSEPTAKHQAPVEAVAISSATATAPSAAAAAAAAAAAGRVVVHVATVGGGDDGAGGGLPPPLPALPAGLAPAGQVANARLLCRLLASPRLAPHLTNFLRFVTGCPSFATSAGTTTATGGNGGTGGSYGGGGLRWHLHFKADMPTCFAPEAHTCFQALYLSAAPYEADELARGLILCAQHCTTFGQQ